MRPNSSSSSSVAAYILRPNLLDPTYEEERMWISGEHFPEQECSVVLTDTLPSDLPKDLMEHLTIGQLLNPESVIMVVRPIKS